MVGAIQIKRIDKSNADPLFLKKTTDKAILSLYPLKKPAILRFFPQYNLFYSDEAIVSF